jgi:NCS2 family nucleobase:cation symporter-2
MNYGALDNLAIAATVLLFILLLVKYTKGFIANISVLLGIVGGCAVAIAMGKMNFDKVGKAAWFDLVTPFAFGMPTFDILMILTMVVVMIVVMIESTGMFLALSDLTGKKISQAELSAGLRTDGLGTLIGGVFNTFPYTSFSQNVGLVGVTGVKSRWVCVAGGVIMVILGLIPKMAAFVEAIPQFVLGGAGLVMFGMVAATGIRILATVDYKGNRNNLYIVALAVGFGLIPLVAPRWSQQMAAGLHPLLDSGILLTAVAAVVLNIFFNGANGDAEGSIEAAKTGQAH